MANKIEFLVTAKDATQRVFDEIDQSLGGIEKQLTKVTAAVAAGAAAATAYGLKLADQADELERSAQLLGVSAQTLREWQFAAWRAAGITSDQLAGALQKLATKAGEASRGNTELEKTFASLGISQEDLQGQLGDLEQLFPEVVRRIAEMGSGYEQLSVSQKLFEESGVRIANIARTGEQAFDQLTERFREQAGVLTNEEIRALAEAKRELSAWTDIIEHRALTALAKLTPEIYELARSLAGVYGVGLAGEQNRLRSAIEDWQDEIEDLNEKLNRIQSVSPLSRSTEQARQMIAQESAFIRQQIADREADIRTWEQRLSDLAEARARDFGGAPAGAAGTGTGVVAAAGTATSSALLDDFRQQQLALLEEQLALEQRLRDEHNIQNLLSLEQEKAWSAERLALAQMEAEAQAAVDAASTENARREAQERADFEKKLERDKILNQTQSTLQRFAIAAQGHKKLFELGKVAAIAEAIVNTRKAIQAARAAAPPPLNYALAAIEAAAGAANIAAISSATFGGGAATVQSAGPGGYAPALPQGPATAVEPGKQQQGTVEIVVRGGDSAGQALLDLLSVEINQRDQVLIGPNSRQAADLKA